MQTTGHQIIQFYEGLDLVLPANLGVEVMNPYKNEEVQSICTTFYNRYFDDFDSRIFIIAINPGRFGAGVTGLPFTDPTILKDRLGIQNSFPKRKELSAIFIYELIEWMGGVEYFYKNFFFGNVSPLGFTQNGKNLNYYDDKPLQYEITPWIIEQLNYQIQNWGRRDVAFSLGKGDNYTFIQQLNKKYGWFEKILPLPHPRWVMQYKLRQKTAFLQDVAATLMSSLPQF
jgi:hypothetical protein